MVLFGMHKSLTLFFWLKEMLAYLHYEGSYYIARLPLSS
jgi:hypothetical protein